MNNKIKKYIKESIKYTIVFIIALNIMNYYKSLDLNKEKLKIQEFELLNNEKYLINKEKPLLIHFWATWCPICELEASNIEKVSKNYQVVTIATQSGNKKEIKKYLEKNNLTFKVVNDENGFLTKQFKIKAFPTTFIYDKNQNLNFSEVGYTSTLGLYLRMWWSN